MLNHITAVGLAAYQWLKVQGLEDCTGIANFTSLMNVPFDALNLELPHLRVKSRSEEIEVHC